MTGGGASGRLSKMMNLENPNKKGTTMAGYLPQIALQNEVIGLVSDIAKCYRDSRINAEIQQTEREKLRQQARVMIARHNADMNRAIEEIRKDSVLNVELIRTVRDIMTQKDVDKDIIDLCKCMMGYLR